MLPRWLLHSDRDEPHHDAGLQTERTAMAWQRTALGVGGVSALLLHQSGGRLLSALPGLFGLAMATTLLVLSELRYERTASRVGSGADPVDARLLLLLAVTVSLISVLAIGLILIQG